ncbi:hypothetical protein WJX81_003308 [Elliptochloris bilobata]|uniref:Fe2OG dioxygenase domain-containing protein n=1 Tax=Elliptochloris bilobata TaxID=381761 RepID=A0AAW1QN06_9CHLO
MALEFELLRTRPTGWSPADARVVLNARMDARIVPDSGCARLHYAHLVVLDDFVGDIERGALLDLLTAPGWDHGQGPPPSKWERATADGAGLPATWGLTDEALAALAADPPPAMLEVHARLAALFPDAEEREAAPAVSLSDPEGMTDRKVMADAPVRCAAFVGNAAVAGDAFAYHVDADPAAFPDSPWRARFGDYANGARGRPLLVSLLVYLDAAWPRDWGAETLFLDGRTDVGIAVRPKPGRAVLMDQDLLHRVSAPSPAAGSRPRYSLVRKLALLPRANLLHQTALLRLSELPIPLGYSWSP